MDITIRRDLKTPYYAQIATQIRARIITKDLTDGAVLPSERQMAARLGVHRNTVIRAYKELQDAGLIEPKQGSGYVVTLPEAKQENTRHGRVNWAQMLKNEYIDAERTFDELFSQSFSDDIISFAAGMPEQGIYSPEDLTRALESAMEQGKRGQYYFSPYQGSMELRKDICAFLRERGIKANPSEIQIFFELNQAMDFLTALLLRPGDTVITEEPVSPDIYRTFDMAGVSQVSVPMDKNGMFCDNLDSIIEKYNPKLIHVSSSFHDPTGSILSFERRKKLIEISREYRIPIIEDDAASLLDYGGLGNPPIKALDRDGNVIYIYSFELTFIPGLNVTFVLAPKEITQALGYLVSLRLMKLEAIPQKVLETFLKDGTYYKAVDHMRRDYAEKRDLMHGMIEAAGIEGFHAQKPDGGVYLWCHIPDGLDIEKLSKLAIARGVSFIPGNVFYRSGKQEDSYIRLNYSSPSKDEIFKGMGILTNTIRELMEK
ncbi:MAG: PLP-dependent aminotransferase family protein [Firmicutes bacterium]|nr:PLP-dependent aminotransferase family protein [Bacillota bacterium]